MSDSESDDRNDTNMQRISGKLKEHFAFLNSEGGAPGVIKESC